MEKREFIEAIAKSVIKWAPQYGIKVASSIIAQACLESGYGTSDKAEHHNYFGLKYRKNRVDCHTGYFRAGSSEQKADGSYEPISTDWYAFADMDSGVHGYFQFIDTTNYANLKGVTDPHEYLRLIRADNYATSLNYVENVWAVVEKWKLQEYDKQLEEVSVVGYTNSGLVSYTKLSPNHSGQRTHKIDRITPHCVVGQLSAEGIAACFPSGRNASCNYGIGYDGRISLICEEKNRSWCTSSNANDQRAITIEVASDKTEPYAFTDEAYNSLVKLCVDICKRNGLKKVLWFGDKDKSLNYNPADGECVLTVHRWFANKSCPGNWMYARMGQLADAINKALGTDIGSTETNGTASSGDKQNLYKVQVGAYSIKANAEARLARIKAAGFDAFITQVSKASESFTPRKSAEEIAKEIWTGKCSDSRWSTWGTGGTRKQRLEAAGYDYDAVQKAIKRLYG